MEADRIYAGILEGRRTIDGVDLVVVKRPNGPVALPPDMFPSDVWIEENRGKWVHMVAQNNRVIEVKPGVDPNKYLKVHPEAQKIGVTCVICHETVCYAPDPSTVSIEVAKEALKPFVAHMKDRHPEESSEILESL